MSTAVRSPTSALVAESFTGFSWRLAPADERLSLAIARDYDIHPLLARLLLARGIKEDELENFLNPSLKTSLPDPSCIKDMDAAAERIASAVMGGETIAIFGDYDVDGATSSALLSRFLTSLGAKTIVYIPDRITEGYGPNTRALLELKEKGASLVITVDCGTMSFEPLEAAHEAGIDVIVADHHIGGAEKPKAYAIVNPNRLDESCGLGQLAAVGVCFLLAIATNRSLRDAGWYQGKKEPSLLALLDLVALGTVCDVVPLTGANRALVAQGLKVMAARGNLGLRTLLDVARVDEPPECYHAGFVLGPRINAGGRVGCAALGSTLLCSEDESEALKIAKALDGYNEERKAIESAVLEEALAQAAKQDNSPLILVHSEGWHPGVIGIVAGRLKERFHKPAAVIAMENGTGKASARSISGFDFGAAVISAKEKGILVAGGGHAMAAGFTVTNDKLQELHAYFCERVHQQLPGGSAEKLRHADACIALSAANIELADALALAAPFGPGNPNPRLIIQHATIAHATQAGSDHIRIILSDEGNNRLTAMSFRTLSTPFGQQLLTMTGKRIHAFGQLRKRMWQGQEQLSFHLEDIALAA